MNRNNITVSILTAVVLIWVVNTVFTAARARILDIAKPALKTSHTISSKIKSFLSPETKLAKEKSLKDILEVWKAGAGLVSVIKWLGKIAAAITAIGAAWYMLTHWHK